MAVTNPCFCINTRTVTVVPSDPCPDLSCCLKACNAIVACTNSVGPCSSEFSLDLSELNHIVNGCSSTLKYALVQADSSLTEVAVTEGGLLTGKSPESITSANKFFDVYYRIVCTAKEECTDCFKLESIGVIKIGIKDLCQGSTCADGQECNACTGLCVDTFNLSAEGEGGFNLQAN